MKKISYFLVVIFLFSCTSNTIFEKPKDLIPKDSMSLIIQELFVASSAKFINNQDFKKGVNYMPIVYNKYKIDSTRFQNSNLYYMSKIDLYQEIFESAKANLEKQKAFYDKLKKKQDSIRKDSIKKLKEKQLLKDSILIDFKLDTILPVDLKIKKPNL